MSDSPAVAIRELCMSYDGRRVVDQLTMTAPRGALTVVLGPNGAGKTTTLETAEGFRAAQGGNIRVLGLDPILARSQLAPRVGVMLQSGGVWPALKARTMLRHMSRLYAHPLPVEGLIDRLGLGTVADTPYRRMSGGEQRRLALACALVGRPELVFLDEPSAGLDPEGRLDMWEFLRELRAAGTSIVATTHLLDEAQALADHVVVIDSGRVAAAGSVGDLIGESPTLRFTARPQLEVASLTRHLGVGYQVAESAPGQYRVDGEVSPDTVAAVTSWCALVGVLPEALTTSDATLEQAYFEITRRSRNST